MSEQQHHRREIANQDLNQLSPSLQAPQGQQTLSSWQMHSKEGSPTRATKLNSPDVISEAYLDNVAVDLKGRMVLHRSWIQTGGICLPAPSLS